jgi:formylglycine-generating enzyme required for sulfatase activity
LFLAAAVGISAGCAGPARRARRLGIEWVRIPGGSFAMGSTDLNEGPIHRVTVKPFDMAKTMVTNKQYRACVKALVCTPSDEKDGFKDDDQPVVGVDWSQARTFSLWVGGGLPSEAQWEYAARSAGKDWKFPWGNEPYSCELAVGARCGSATAPVCSRPKGNTAQGLCDMAGNAWEWTQDWYHPSYDGAPADGTSWENPPGTSRIFRGGSWFGGTEFGASHRNGLPPESRGDVVSFRPVRPSRD